MGKYWRIRRCTARAKSIENKALFEPNRAAQLNYIHPGGGPRRDPKGLIQTPGPQGWIQMEALTIAKKF